MHAFVMNACLLTGLLPRVLLDFARAEGESIPTRLRRHRLVFETNDLGSKGETDRWNGDTFSSVERLLAEDEDFLFMKRFLGASTSTSPNFIPIPEPTVAPTMAPTIVPKAAPILAPQRHPLPHQSWHPPSHQQRQPLPHQSWHPPSHQQRQPLPP